MPNLVLLERKSGSATMQVIARHWFIFITSFPYLICGTFAPLRKHGANVMRIALTSSGPACKNMVVRDQMLMNGCRR
jgi:hypothetical protein